MLGKTCCRAICKGSKEKVLDVLGEAASKLRGELGESLATVQKFDVPLPQATTSSLEALKQLSLGGKTANDKGYRAGLPYYQRAIELDPNFAYAYYGLGILYGGSGEPGRASENYEKAFQLRQHTSEREKLEIATTYYQNVTGELDKSAATFQEWIESYPQDPRAYANFTTVLSAQGQYQKAWDISRQAQLLAPDRVLIYINLAAYALALQRFDDARQVLQMWQERSHSFAGVEEMRYALAFMGDPSEMADQQKWLAGQHDHLHYALASDTEAYAGHIARARELTQQSVEAAMQTDSQESGAIWEAVAAQREAAYGNAAKARQTAAEALKLAPQSQGAEVEATLAFAIAGDTPRAESLAQDLGKRFPLDTQVQSLWLPAIQAQLALDRKNPAVALNLLQAATSPLELGEIQFAINLSCLYPAYVRGEAHLAAGQGAQAAAEFQKILDHSGIVWNCWTGALAHLRVARVNALESRTSQGADAEAARVRALAAYKDFLTLWKDADPDIPILKEAKTEYAKLQ